MQNYRAFTSRYGSQAQLALCMFHGKSAAVWWLPSGRMDSVEFEQIIWQRVWWNPAPQARGALHFSGKRRGWPPFLGPSPAVRTQPALLLSVLCHQSPGRARNLPRSAKPPFYWKNFQNEHVHWDDCRSQKRDTGTAKCETEGSSEIWCTRSLTFLYERALFPTSYCLYRTSTWIFLPVLWVCRAHSQEERLYP